MHDLHAFVSAPRLLPHALPALGRSTWYACTEPSEGLECEPNVSLGADGFICKEPAQKSA